MHLPHTRFSRAVDRIIAAIGATSSWLWALLMAVIVINVIVRYFFGFGRIEFEELQWHIYSAGFLIALSFGLQADSHIRVDVVRERLSPRMQAWIELYGLILLLLPFILFVLIYAIPFVINSYLAAEISSSPGGLPYRWLIKSMMLVGFLLLLIATVSRLTRVWSFLFRSTNQ